MKPEQLSFGFFCKTDIIALLYLYLNEVLVVRHLLLNQFQSLEDLPFIRFVSKERETFAEKPYLSEKDKNLLCYEYHIPNIGFAFIKEDKQEFNEFIREYINSYQNNTICNRNNYLSFELSLKETIDFLQKMQNELGKSFSITEELVENLEKNKIRWVEILIYLYINGYIDIKNVRIDFKVNNQSKPEDYVTAELSFYLLVFINDILNIDKNVKLEFLGIQILQDNTIRFVYDGKKTIIPFKYNGKIFRFLELLIKNHGSNATLKQVLNYVNGEEPEECDDKDANRIGRYASEIKTKFEEATGLKELPFAIVCASKSERNKSGQNKKGYYIYRKF